MGLGLLAGCSGGQETPTDTGTGTPTATEPATPTATGTPREHPNAIFVDADAGRDRYPGTRDEPVRRIQTAMERATPGTVVRVQPGYYRNNVWTVRGGTAEDPIVVTGPPEAVFNSRGAFEINHSHVHLRGLTFDGLIEASESENLEAYAESLIIVNRTLEFMREGADPPATADESDYLTDIVVKPHRVGNCRADFIKHQYANDVEIGEFEVFGPAGVKFTKGDADGHNSEIVYLGTPWYHKDLPPDDSSNIHVHHIDNSGGYQHAELVDCKTGLSDVTIEYCTDYGGANAAVSDDTSGGAIVLGGTDITVRWNDISSGSGAGIEFDSDAAAADDPHPAARNGGANNTVYGNRLLDNAGNALQYPYHDEGQGQADQRVVCGNEFDGATQGDPDAPCPSDVPTTERIGHLGGDSPWD